MKELSIEEKAKRYDEAIKKFDVILNLNTVKESGTIFADDVRKIFPELAEKWDEKIRKELLAVIDDLILPDEQKERFVAWLEKQGENIYNKELSELLHKVICRFINDPDIPYSDREKVSIKVLPYVELLEKQDEKKPDPVLDIDIPFGAKDSELQEASYHIPKGFHAKIEGNRVVIKRGEQKPAEWTEEDETTKNNINHIIRQYDKISKKENQPCWYVGDCLLWMQNIKERVQPQPRQEWREEDYNFIKELCDLLASISKDGYVGKYYTVDLVEKLKSLKPQKTWKPSDEQMDVIEAVVNNRSFQRRHLDSLYEQLKKLREG